MSTAAACREHPSIAARYACFVCKAPICDRCVRARDDGVLVCPTCENPEALDLDEPIAPQPPIAAPHAQTSADEGMYDLSGPPATETLNPVAIKYPCVNHPNVNAVARCESCGALVCPTCDFAFPNNVHLCPTCATNPKQALKGKRKAFAFWSMGLGIASILTVIATVIILRSAVHNVEDPVAILGGCAIVLIVPAMMIVGLILGFLAFDRRSHNPGYLWVGPILNGVLVLTYIIRIITMIV